MGGQSRICLHQGMNPVVWLAGIWLAISLLGRTGASQGGIRRRAWGRVHMMRSGKRSDPAWEDDDDSDLVPDIMESNEGKEFADADPVENPKLRRVSRSLGRNKWGGVHMLRTGKRSGQEVGAGAGTGAGWGANFLRTLRGRAGLARRGGRRSWFGGGHMMRSGKRSSWGPCGPDGDDDIETDEDDDLIPDEEKR